MIPRWELTPVSERIDYRLDPPRPRLFMEISVELLPFVKSNIHNGFVGLESAVTVEIWR